jgi:hypothetical protein
MFQIHASHARGASKWTYESPRADRETGRLLNHPNPAMRLNGQVGAPIVGERDDLFVRLSYL